MGRTLMDHNAASRISEAARDPETSTAQSGFGERAVAAADRNDPYDYDDPYEDEEDRDLNRLRRPVDTARVPRSA
jgi:hypothetical protein